MRYIILNRTNGVSLFQKGLNEVLKYPGDELILGYGFLESSIVTKPQFLQAIVEGFSSEQGCITIIGANEQQISKYIESIEAIQKYIDNQEKSISIRLIVKKINHKGARQYHKKIAIKLNNGEPIIALIGSSNLSKNTYDNKNEDDYYTTEVDILFWNAFLVKREKEEDILKNTEQESKIDRFNNLRVSEKMINSILKTKGIDFSIDFELQDIISEIKNFEENSFYEVYNSEWMKISYYDIYCDLIEDINYLIVQCNKQVGITKEFINKFRDFEDKVRGFSKTNRGRILEYIVLDWVPFMCRERQPDINKKEILTWLEEKEKLLKDQATGEISDCASNKICKRECYECIYLDEIFEQWEEESLQKTRDGINNRIKNLKEELDKLNEGEFTSWSYKKQEFTNRFKDFQEQVIAFHKTRRGKELGERILNKIPDLEGKRQKKANKADVVEWLSKIQEIVEDKE